ncbi:MAG TPA: helix-turn-helix domain-containing protein, partial [Aggregatilineales bacterium]|nr:helix-turn-helix domain-containing protein [Aggregatilineales bacterium]
QNALQEVMQKDPVFVQTLWQIYAQRLEHLAKLGEGLGAWKVAARINDCLIAYATPAEPHPIVELTHEKLADLAGTVREVVSRHLLELESDGIIHLETGCITLLDLDSLKSACLMNTTE